MGFATSGSFPADITPVATKNTLAANYLDFTTGTGKDWSQQYLPELYEAEVERYGNRTVSSFLRMVGAEMPMTSDQVVWSEQTRLHIAYSSGVSIDTSTGVLTVPSGHALRANQTVVLSDGFNTAKGIIGASPGALSVNCYPYTAADWSGFFTTGEALNVFVYGSEFGKGGEGMKESIEPSFEQFDNSPIIIKDRYAINGSDTAQIGWVEVATEDGTSGYLWYLKSQSETRLRFEDYLEMACIEGELASGTGSISANAQHANITGFSATNVVGGTQGLFAAIEARGNVWNDFAGAAAPGSGALGDFDAILKHLDAQGAIEENMLFLNRSTALDFDDMIAAQTGGGYASAASASYGVFNNEAEMALNFGFSGFRRGSYDFYKTDWKYLNDATTRGLTSDIDGVLVPAGTSTVYDQMLGQNIRRPFLHVRYRASETDDRRMKSWLTGSVGGAYTSDLDAMEVHFLSERCLVTQAANNFVLMKSTS